MGPPSRLHQDRSPHVGGWRRWAERTAKVCLTTFFLIGCEAPPADTGPASSATDKSVSSASAGPSAARAAGSTTATPDPRWDAGTGAPVRVKIRASEDGFQPEVAEFIQGRPAFLDFELMDDTTCVNAVRMPWAKKATSLRKGETVSIRIPDTSQDGEFQYACWMNMVFGKVVIRPGGGGPADSAKTAPPATANAAAVPTAPSPR